MVHSHEHRRKLTYALSQCMTKSKVYSDRYVLGLKSST